MSSLRPFVLLVVLGLGGPASHGATAPGFLFADFEAASGWRPGAFPNGTKSLSLAQGQARIVPTPQAGPGQAIELPPSTPFSAVLLDASPLAARSIVYAEVFVRPVALGENRNEEFFDFGGAVLGFFRNGDFGEICALYGKSEAESVWISSGVRIPLTAEGTAASWLRLTVRLNHKVGRWDLTIDGRKVLSGLRTVSPASSLRLWLYGDRSQPTLFDDLLIANLPPGELEEELAREPSRALRHATAPTSPPGRQVVTRAKPNAELRQSAEPLRAARGVVRLDDWHVSLESGGITYREPEGESDLKLIAYAPSFDDDGNPRPVTLTLTADAELEPGADLAAIRWRVTELLGLEKYGETILQGDFRSGLVQTVTIPPKWARKATAVFVWKDSE